MPCAQEKVGIFTKEQRNTVLEATRSEGSLSVSSNPEVTHMWGSEQHPRETVQGTKCPRTYQASPDKDGWNILCNGWGCRITCPAQKCMGQRGEEGLSGWAGKRRLQSAVGEMTGSASDIAVTVLSKYEVWEIKLPAKFPKE